MFDNNIPEILPVFWMHSMDLTLPLLWTRFGFGHMSGFPSLYNKETPHICPATSQLLRRNWNRTQIMVSGSTYSVFFSGKTTANLLLLVTEC